MVNIAYVVPRIVGFRQVINPIVEARPVRTAQGDATQLSKSSPSLSISIGFVDPSGDINGSETYTFSDTPTNLKSLEQLLAAAGVQVETAWEAAFDAAKEQFVKTADQPDSAKATGIKWYMRVDLVEAALNPKEPMGLRMVVGCYKDAGYTKFASAFELAFVDSKTMQTRQAQIDQLTQSIAALEEMVAGTHVNQTGMSDADLLKSKNAAANDLVINLGNKARLESALVAPLSQALGVTAVQQAFAAVAQAVFTELQAKLPEWSDIQVAAVMQHFGPALAGVVAA